MLKWLALAVVGVFGIWFYFVDGRKLDEPMVRDYYQQKWHATYSRNPDALCDQLASNLQLNQESRVFGRTRHETLDRDDACEDIRSMYTFFEKAGDKAGGILTIEYSHELAEIHIAPDRKSATVVVTSLLKMGETFMQISTTATERLERNRRRVQLAQADAKVNMHWKVGAYLNPEPYFQTR